MPPDRSPDVIEPLAPPEHPIQEPPWSPGKTVVAA